MREHPRSRALAERAREHLLGGVPMHDGEVAGGPLFVAEARGSCSSTSTVASTSTSASGHRGDGRHGPRPRSAPSPSSRRGDHDDAPRRNALWAAEERPVGCVTRWQFALTATDANRFSIRLARHVTGGEGARLQLVLPRHRRRVVRDARGGRRRAATGQPRPTGPAVRDDEGRGVERRRGWRRRSRLGTSRSSSPSLLWTNVGIVHPDPGFHDALRALTRETGTLGDRRDPHDLLRARRLHGPARPRARRRHSRQADRRRHPRLRVRVHRRAGRPHRRRSSSRTPTSEAGGTLAANAPPGRDARATLAEVLTDEAFARMIPSPAAGRPASRA